MILLMIWLDDLFAICMNDTCPMAPVHIMFYDLLTCVMLCRSSTQKEND